MLVEFASMIDLCRGDFDFLVNKLKQGLASESIGESESYIGDPWSVIVRGGKR